MLADLSSFLSDILDLAYPVSVLEVVKNDVDKRLDVYLSVEKSYLPSSDYIRHGYYRGRKWRHLDCFEYRCYLHCDLPIFRHKASGQTFQLDLALSRKGCGITLKLERRIMDLMQDLNCFSEVARGLGLYPQVVESVYHHYTQQSYEALEVRPCEAVLVDEVSTKRAHQYITSFVDDQGRFLWIAEGRSSDTFEDFFQAHPYPEAVRELSMDMSPAFIKGAGRYFGHATITFDKWHLYKHIFKPIAKRVKAGKVSPEDYQDLKACFGKLYEQRSTEEASAFLAFWIEYAQEKIGLAKKTIRSIQKHWKGIVQQVESKLSNGRLEGINNKIQLIKRKARGFRSTENLKKMIFFAFGKIRYQDNFI
ncbi:MAG: ISL3 family transposase [Sphaerospermopsis sp. SIO1G2]|nr:ISL3 family transposase [Sphaerospermopsis sp. SIO1G2]